MRTQDDSKPDYLLLSASGTDLIKSSPGKLLRILLTKTTTFTAIIYDNFEGSGRVIADFDIASSDKLIGEWNFSCEFFIALTIVTTGTPAFTVVFE